MAYSSNRFLMADLERVSETAHRAIEDENTDRQLIAEYLLAAIDAIQDDQDIPQPQFAHHQEG